jgi:hypothetical protein
MNGRSLGRGPSFFHLYFCAAEQAAAIAGTSTDLSSFCNKGTKEATMPVILLWAVPAVIIVGGGVYYFAHLAH